MTIVEWAKKNLHKFSDKTDAMKACAKELNVKYDSVKGQFSLHKLWDSDKKQMKAPKGAMTRKSFLSKYDEDTKVRESVKRGLVILLDSPGAESDHIVKDVEFRMEYCQCNHAVGWKTITQEPQFRKYQFRSGQDIFWTAPRTKEWALANVSKAREL